MKIRAMNLGPVSKAELEVFPFTVLIGKNQLGKSYLAQLIQVSYLLAMTVPRELYFRYGLGHEFEKFKEALLKARRENKTRSDTVHELVNAVLYRYKEVIERNLKSILEETYGVPVSNLIRAGSQSAHIDFEMSDITCISFEIEKRDKVKLDIKINHSDIDKFVLEHVEKNKINLRDLRRKTDLEEVLMSIRQIIISQTTFLIPFYIPAGRAGLLEGLDTVAKAIVKVSTIAPIRGFSIAPLSGTTSQFYTTFTELLSKSRSYYRPFLSSYREFPYYHGKKSFKTASSGFKKIIGGEILLVEDSEQTGVRKMKYQFKSGGKKVIIDIIHAASMVKELAPIYLIIRDLASERTCIIIEEPESHLHPGAQLDLLNLFSDLVKEGLNIVITTHSDIILRKISNLIGSFHDGEINVNAFNPNQVRIYWLRDEASGSILETISIDKTGIGELPIFDEVIEDLYKEELGIQQKHLMEE